MGRKPKMEKRTITVVVNGTVIPVILHPPKPPRRTWYAYWPGLTASKSTGQREFEQAALAAEDMLRNGGNRGHPDQLTMSDEEFEEIQRRHYGKKADRKRAEQTLYSCMNAIAAFRKITGLVGVTTATPDDCARFQTTAEGLPRDWRHDYPQAKDADEPLSRNTILKWCRTLQAAFQRANKNAGKKCVRGVVDEQKLLTKNPWHEFTWIEGTKRAIRQFDADELLGLLDFLENGWPEVTVAAAVAKTLLWSWSRRLEVMRLDWGSLRTVGGERHFHILGKWGVEKWFRIPEALYQEMEQLRTQSPFVFAAYNDQLQRFFEKRARPQLARTVGNRFEPENLGDWLHRRIVQWSKSLPKGHATTHVFRKTTLQLARRGEDVNRLVAQDARLSEGVMMTNYVMELDEEFRQRSNRTYHRILAALPLKVAERYGYAPTERDRLGEQLRAAVAMEDWDKVAGLSARLKGSQSGG